MRGNLKGILKQATFLEQLDEKFVPFAEQLRQFAQNFQEKELLEFISQYSQRHPRSPQQFE